jgi:hypothetical protein
MKGKSAAPVLAGGLIRKSMVISGADHEQTHSIGAPVAEYHLLTIWHIEAPMEKVYTSIHDSPCWPDWWPGVRKVEQIAAGDVDGIDSVWRYAWQGKFPYRLVFEVCATRIEKLVAIEGTVRGDLEGIGRWHFSRQGAVSVVHCEWQVRSTRWWMNLIAPFARSMFIHNHALLMTQGGAGLARLLRSPLVSQETIDLMAIMARPQAALGRWPVRGWFDLEMVLLVGLVAGVVAAVAQIILWWLAGMPLPEIFFRDARLTAALVMGKGVLTPMSTPQWYVLLVATLIHFMLSIVYAMIPAHLAGRLRTGPTIFVGASYGLVIYVVNLYGLTLLFPWFAVARNWVTLVTHILFGITLAEGCRLFAQTSTERKKDGAQGSVMSK